jgi:hypothetical protein
MIATIWTCDYCGEEIFGPYYATIAIGGRGIDMETGEDVKLKDERQYHAGTVDSCYRKVADALNLVEDAAPSLEAIPTISSQAVAARRRKHTRPEGAS